MRRSTRSPPCLPAGLPLSQVFGSPSVIGSNVMLTVATSDVITGPSRLLFPRELGGMGEVRQARTLTHICMQAHTITRTQTHTDVQTQAQRRTHKHRHTQASNQTLMHAQHAVHHGLWVLARLCPSTGPRHMLRQLLHSKLPWQILWLDEVSRGRTHPAAHQGPSSEHRKRRHPYQAPDLHRSPPPTQDPPPLIVIA